MINFILWKWVQPKFRETYTAAHVNAMVAMLAKTCRSSHRVICVTDDPRNVECETFPIWKDHSELKNLSGGNLPSCYRRLKIFDPTTLWEMGVPIGERVVSLDLDTVLIKDLAPLFDRSEQFVGWHVPGHRHRWVLNGSMFMFTAGEMEWLWREFDPAKSPTAAIKAGYMGSDQGYLSHRLIGKLFVGAWTAQSHGVKSYARDVRLPRALTTDTRIVFFAGSRKPWHPQVQRESAWISRYVDYDESSRISDREVDAHAAL